MATACTTLADKPGGEKTVSVFFNRRGLHLIIMLAVMLGLQGCWQGDDNLPPVEKSPAANFTLKLFDGGEFKMAEHAGHPVFVNFFASWCIPCGEEASDLEAGYQEYKDKGVRFVGVASQDTESKAKGFVKKHALTFPTGLDDTGKIREAYGVFGMPTSFFIDRKGIISYLHIGGVSKDLLKYELDKLL
jgi:cytochrome c biogenesis protein CcmG, thiol:disulfide interchange protein DsbE